MRIFVLLILVSYSVYGNVKEDAEEAIEKFTKSNNIQFVKYGLDQETKVWIERESKQRFFGLFLYKWTVFESDTIKNIVLLDNVMGKTQPISFMVMFDVDGKIEYCEIVKYREDHGGQVQDKNWLMQFHGKNYKSSFTVGKDIDGISGATISTNSLSKGIFKLSLLIQRIMDE